MKNIPIILTTILYIGTVDYVESGIASVEITASDDETHYAYMPTLAFPCEIKEKDFFYFMYIDDTVEIRGGEPPV